jgi:hypothetical protein
MRYFALLLAAAASLAAAGNTLSPGRKGGRFRLLFDGRTMNGWLDPAKQNAPGDAWMVEDGTLRTVLKPRISEDLLTVDEFADFELCSTGASPNAAIPASSTASSAPSSSITPLASPGPNGFEGMLGRELAGPVRPRQTRPRRARRSL